jgi:hypothetical protein
MPLPHPDQALSITSFLHNLAKVAKRNPAANSNHASLSQRIIFEGQNKEILIIAIS